MTWQPEAARILLAVDLEPLQGDRFQPTGFPELQAAEYDEPGTGSKMLLVESAQSMANRLEAVCWNEPTADLVPELRGLPYVRARLVDKQGEVVGETASLLEAHRLNSPYLMSADDGAFRETLRQRAGLRPKGATGVFDRRQLAAAVFHYDPGSLLHGIFLEKLDGRARLQRVLSAFIEARGVQRAVSGGVKLDRANASGATQEGYGNVPYLRTEYTAEAITAYFSLDVAQIRAYGLGEAAEQMLITLALWKIRRLLEGNLRLRTACDLKVKTLADGETAAIRPEPRDFVLPEAATLAGQLRELIPACAELFADPRITELTWQEGKAKKEKDPETGDQP